MNDSVERQKSIDSMEVGEQTAEIYLEEYGDGLKRLLVARTILKVRRFVQPGAMSDEEDDVIYQHLFELLTTSSVALNCFRPTK